MMCGLGVGGRKQNERQDAQGPHHQMGTPMTSQLGAEDPAESTEAGDLKELHGALLSTQSVEQFLHEMAVLAARLVSGGLSCGMTMWPNGRPVTVACSDQVAARVDEVQYEHDDGPCLHAMRDGHMVRIEDTAEKVRWPEFEAQAASHGIRSCLALPLNADAWRAYKLRAPTGLPSACNGRARQDRIPCAAACASKSGHCAFSVVSSMRTMWPSRIACRH